MAAYRRFSNRKEFHGRDEKMVYRRQDKEFLQLSNRWNQASIKHHYAYNFTWLGRPIIQAPQDIYAMQELIWRVAVLLLRVTIPVRPGLLRNSGRMWRKPSR